MALRLHYDPASKHSRRTQAVAIELGLPIEFKLVDFINRWLFWLSSHFGPACIALTWERVMKPTCMKQEPDARLVQEGETNLKRFGAVLNSQLEGREYVTGKLSLADFGLASVLITASRRAWS